MESESPIKTKALVYRYKLSPEIMDKITVFAKIHQHDSRQDYKESWDEWYNNQDFEREELRLKQLGYNNDFEDKLFKAGRYYFRKKDLHSKQKEQKRRDYINVNYDVLTAMDTHIKTNMNNKGYSPADGFNKFCEENKILLKEEILRMMDLPINNDLISNKIKKTYKNRFYLINKNKNNNE